MHLPASAPQPAGPLVRAGLQGSALHCPFTQTVLPVCTDTNTEAHQAPRSLCVCQRLRHGLLDCRGVQAGRQVACQPEAEGVQEALQSAHTEVCASSPEFEFES